TVTSQAPERIYRALSEPARVTTTLEVRDGARLAWVPQETILFDGARLHRRTEIRVSSGAELFALEWFVLGRAARGERVVEGEISDSWRIVREGRLVWADTFRAADDTFPHLGRKALLRGYSALATLVYSGADLDRRLEVVRELLASLPC